MALPAVTVRFANAIWLTLSVLVAMLMSSTLAAADLSEAEALFKAGEYAECTAATSTALEEENAAEAWHQLRIRSQLATGEYAAAAESLEVGLNAHSTSIELRWLGVEVQRFAGNPAAADLLAGEIAELARTASWRYRDSLSLVTLGRFFLAHGADAKEVLTGVYAKAKTAGPRFAEPYLASGQLALAKHDYGLAAESLEQAAKLDPLDPEIPYSLALAYAPSDSERATASLQAALKLNPQHVPSLLELVDEQIDAERYAEAEQLIEQVLAVNDKQPLAWAYTAVLAHLDNDTEAEQAARQQALATWSENPEVDHLIGKKLSQKYRFAESSGYQRKSLAFDPSYLPAKMQLSQDLLRLGEEAQGWAMAAEVFERDNYNVMAHNLTTLHDRLDKFAVLEADGFLVRMDATEAKIYGQRVLALLGEAKGVLCKKYNVELEEPIYVDIYPRQQDFAIRTFGLPGGAGFLGVCFGRVVTMNSPASQGATPSNWEAVLWHEFCHVVTLSKTNNRMPRWLSEGISVYEEQQRNRSWGQPMNLRYREMILGGELTPVSKLSGAFLKPASPLHLQFAYFESAMVVEYLVETYGQEMLERVLVDLGVGMPINDSLKRYVGSLEALDQEFEQYARQQAEELAPEADFSESELEPSASAEEIAEYLKQQPNNFSALQKQAKQFVADEQWEAAKQPLEKLLELHPTYAGADNALSMLAEVHAELNESDQQRERLNQLAELRSDALEIYLQLAELAKAADDWPAVRHHTEQALAVNPLLKAPQRLLAEAAQQTDDPQAGIAGLSALAVMDPLDPADLQYQLAKLLQQTGQLDAAKRHVLRALAEAPRFRDAHRLLLELVEEPSPETVDNSSTPSE